MNVYNVPLFVRSLAFNAENQWFRTNCERKEGIFNWTYRRPFYDHSKWKTDCRMTFLSTSEHNDNLLWLRTKWKPRDKMGHKHIHEWKKWRSRDNPQFAATTQSARRISTSRKRTFDQTQPNCPIHEILVIIPLHKIHQSDHLFPRRNRMCKISKSSRKLSKIPNFRTTVPPWRREYPIAHLGDQRRILPPPSYPQSQTQQRHQSHPIQSYPYQQNSRQNSQLQNQDSQRYGKFKTRFQDPSAILAPPPRSQPLPLPPARVSTTTARSSTPSLNNQRAYEEIMKEYRRRAEVQKLEL